ncbi:hypothetical protein BDA96_06G281800 [Sorghum bicolor]|uniref:cysteine dioxygenase n=2 Tax=Sorghum bicolor TaxID=4558 RepID=C5YA15_SORBI|nr:plant cysteine oxidase 3 isoform X1 [Sorghum bicolor]EES13054.1 hypothetical protein SORBI_3006G258300 [Sorghum bicolor]KAG0528006.1 hypothetical protein BDA96_06G281800 [Sorghum bicolor]OQU82535.1 hypothetical protein SORBI_3006G258300 [Sorghum bicolor]OQU82537.1 hypothetical protein SORBI_3006G258300 [Sorghum bicolor]|eukprot:XP_002448726.1 plant cysteine oxidase 3 isoform X1 [Sorghum bicolor]
MARGVPQPQSSRVQALYELCKRSFPSPSAAGAASSSPPPADVIRSISSLMDTITPADVGLRDYNLEDDRGHGFFGSDLLKGSGRLPRWARPIKYLHIYSCDAFSIAIFCLPTSSVIPLHDHPGMTVLSKILYGSIHVKSYDWIEPTVLARSQPARLAKLHMDDVLTAPCPTSILYPQSGGNLHCFTSVSSCAVLDVLAPPYNNDAGRLCTYFHDYPFSSLSAAGRRKVAGDPDKYAWLEAINTEVNVYMQTGMYTGPTVQELQA